MVTSTSATAVDKLFYTASLVTNPADIDPLVERVRLITSQPDYAPDRLSAEQLATIAAIQSELEKYLVTQEKLRFFTPESLRLQIEQRAAGDVDKSSHRQLIIVLWVSALLALAAALLLPLATPQQRGLVGGSAAFSLVNLGAAWMFWTALPAFQSSLRKAFLLICVAEAFIGLTLLVYPIVEVFGLRKYPLTSLLLPLPLMVASITFHLGDIKYARLVGVTGRLVTVAPLVVASVLISVFSWILPHQPVGEPEAVFDAAAIMWGIMWVMPIASAFLLPKVVRQVPELYKPPAQALASSMWGIIAVVGYQYILRLIAGPYESGPAAYGLFSLVVLMGLMLLRAGYSFNKVSRY